MKRQIIALVFSLIFPSLAFAEVMAIAIEIHHPKGKPITVSIHSEGAKQSQKNVPVAEAVKHLRKMKGADSGIDVVIVSDDATPSSYMPILQAVVENAEMSLTFVRLGNSKAGRHILKLYNIEQPPERDK